MKVTYVLIAINVILFVIGWQFPLVDAWQLIGYGFSHGNLLHLVVNMLGLLMFGLVMEREMGEGPMVTFYLVCIIFAGMVQLSFGNGIPAMGASGGVFGLVTAYCAMYPDRKVRWFFIPMEARVFLALILSIEVLQMLTGITPGIAHWAHIGGAAGAGLQLAIRK